MGVGKWGVVLNALVARLMAPIHHSNVHHRAAAGGAGKSVCLDFSVSQRGDLLGRFARFCDLMQLNKHL